MSSPITITCTFYYMYRPLASRTDIGLQHPSTTFLSRGRLLNWLPQMRLGSEKVRCVHSTAAGTPTGPSASVTEITIGLEALPKVTIITISVPHYLSEQLEPTRRISSSDRGASHKSIQHNIHMYMCMNMHMYALESVTRSLRRPAPNSVAHAVWTRG